MNLSNPFVFVGALLGAWKRFAIFRRSRSVHVGLLALLGLLPVFGAGTNVPTCKQLGNSGILLITWAWTGDASTGSVPAGTASCLLTNGGPNAQGFRLVAVETVPGSPAPTANYSATITDGNGADELNAAANGNLSASAAQVFSVTYNLPLSGTLTLTLSGNSIASATGTVYAYLAPPAMARSGNGSSGGGGAPSGAAGGALAGSYPNPSLSPNSSTFNGQAVALGASGNVNAGAATHSVGLNEGAGAAITGLALGAHQTPIGQSGADPVAKTIPDCQDSAGNHLNYTQSSDGFSCGTSSSGGGGSTFSLTNAGTTGTTASTLTKATAGTAVIAATSDTNGVIGITSSGAGTTGSATITLFGPVNCVFDGATTANHYVQISPTVAGNCNDAGATPPAGVQIIGRVWSTNASAGTYSIELYPASGAPVIAGAGITQTAGIGGAALALDTGYAPNFIQLLACPECVLFTGSSSGALVAALGQLTTLTNNQFFQGMITDGNSHGSDTATIQSFGPTAIFKMVGTTPTLIAAGDLRQNEPYTFRYTTTGAPGGTAGYLVYPDGQATAASLSAASTLPNSTLATTQGACDNSTKVATTAYLSAACNAVEAGGSPLAATAQSQTLWNNTAGAYVVDLPASASGIQLCQGNYKTVAHAISFVPPSGSTIYYKGAAGTTSSATGLVSGGAAGDFICLEAVDSSTWEAIGAGQGTWTNN